MANDKVRWAVVGLGHIAQTAVLPAFRQTDEAELVALVTSDEVKDRELRGRYNVRCAGGYRALEEILKDSGADAVYIALPNSMHREFTERAARVGVHVLCEKPMATSVEDCRAMIAACRAASVRLMIAYRLHFEAANLYAVDVLRSGRIGERRLFTALLTHDVRADDIRARPEVGGGALFDAGVYPINAARYLFGAEPIEAIARALPGPEMPDVDETTAAILRFPDDRVAQFIVSQRAASVSWYRVVGTDGDLVVDPAFSYAKPMTVTVTHGDNEPVRRGFPKRDQFAAEIDYFSRCLVEGEEPEPSGEEGLLDVRVVEALYESSRIDRPVWLPERDRKVRPGPEQRIDKPGHDEPDTVHVSPPER